MSYPRVVTESDVVEIHQMMDRGMSFAEIGDALGIPEKGARYRALYSPAALEYRRKRRAAMPKPVKVVDTNPDKKWPRHTNFAPDDLVV